MKKGNVALDLLVVGVIMFAIVLTWVWTAKINTDVTTMVIAQNNSGVQGQQMLESQRANFGTLWDNLGVFMFGLIWIFLVISAYNIKTSTVFFVVMFVLTACTFLVLMILGNVFNTINAGAAFSGASVSMPKMVFLVNNLVETMTIVMITVGIALYAKNETGVTNL